MIDITKTRWSSQAPHYIWSENENHRRLFCRKGLDNTETHTSHPQFAPDWLSRFAMVVEVERGKVRRGEVRRGEAKVRHQTRKDHTEQNSTLAEAEKPNKRTTNRQHRDVRMMMAVEGEGKRGVGQGMRRWYGLADSARRHLSCRCSPPMWLPCRVAPVDGHRTCHVHVAPAHTRTSLRGAVDGPSVLKRDNAATAGQESRCRSKR